MSDLLDKLNPAQKKAVLHPGGPALVLAGAGSGKNRVLTTRAAYLLEQNLATPEEILLVTFTNKAAHEMNQRLIKQTGARLPMSGTFHSLCAKILRRHAPLVGLDHNYLIYDTDEQLALIKQIYKSHSLNSTEFKPKAVLAMISNAKNEMLGVAEYQNLATGRFQEMVARVYKIYQHQLLENKAVDFDDLLLLVNKLFAENKAVLAFYQNQIKHVLIDEYQDSNKAQYLLGKYFAKPDDNIFAVGDFSQSIYAWRGADYRNMFLLKKDFPALVEYKLEENYRSSQNILNVATQVISQNNSHPILKLWTKKAQADKIKVLAGQDGRDEAEQIIREVKNNYHYADVAILYRTNAQSRPFEEACIKYGLPYQLVGGFKFYERKEIKDLLAFLKLITNPQDSVSQERVVKLGKRRYSDFEALRDTIRAEKEELSPLTLLEKILEATHYKDRFDDKDPEDVSHLENIAELLNVASEFAHSAQFLENVALIQDQEMVDAAGNLKNNLDRITLMSLHSAKGLEFPVVFIAGLEEGLLPHARSLLDKAQLEEERRLAYVGITRAQDKLYLSYALKRYFYGNSTFSTPSRFLADIDPKLLSATTAPKVQLKAKKRLVVDDDELDSVLSGELDIEEFLNF